MNIREGLVFSGTARALAVALQDLGGRAVRAGQRIFMGSDYPTRQRILYQGLSLPSPHLRRGMGEAFRSNEFYLQSGVVEAKRLATKLGYTRTRRVIDIGCGPGRLATGMLWEYGEVDYLGLDANLEYTTWCRNHIERAHPSFRFVHIDVVNELYNPLGAIDGGNIRLPLADGEAEIIYLWGVFTNMCLEHVGAYTSEIGRIAAEGARVFLTAYVEENVPQVSFNPEGYGPFVYRVPLNVVRYSKEYLFALFRCNGLVVDEFRYHGGSFPCQSEIYLTKRAAPPRAPATPSLAPALDTSLPGVMLSR
jgi:SAM-dependent methyltransferase